MWYVEMFLVFYGIDGRIMQMELCNTMEEYFQWSTIADGYGYAIVLLEEKEWDKVVKNPNAYRIVNGKLKYIVEYAVC